MSEAQTTRDAAAEATAPTASGDPAPRADGRGRTAVITGAGSGIGRATALELAARGWSVALLGRRPEPLEEVAEAARGLGARTLVAPTDITSEEAVEAAFRAVVDGLGRVDLLFNNAGTFGSAGRVDELDAAVWRDVVEVNLTGSFLCAAAAFRVMREQSPQGGRILNNGSVSAHRPRPRSVAYTATKHAMTGLTRSIALDGRAFGITCGQIDIGNTATDLLASLGAHTGALQADGSLRVEPSFPVADAARMIADVASLPPSATVHELVITAAGMPFDGRG